MKTMKLTLLTVLMSLTSSVLLAQPCASFTTSVNNNTVTFTNTTNCPHIYMFTWNYGDATTSNSSATMHNHTYTSTGTFWVRLDVLDSALNVIDTMAHPVTITTLNPPLGPTISGNVSNHGGNMPIVKISAVLSTQATTFLTIPADGSGNYTHTFNAMLMNNSTITSKVTDCHGHANSNSSTYVNTTSAYTLNLDYCPPKPIQALFSKTQAMVNGNPVPGQVVVTDQSTGNNLNYLWDFGDGNSSTSASPAPHTYSGNGPYVLCLTVSDSGYTDTYCDTLSVDSNGTLLRRAPGFTVNFGSFTGPTGIAQNQSKLELNVYPNPANELLNIELKNLNENSQIQIIDLKGQVVLDNSVSMKNNRITLDVNSIESGIYLLRLTSQEEVISQKLIIE